jgi:hypothetical protein
VSIPNAATQDAIQYRTSSFLRDLKTFKELYQSTLIIAHGGTLNVLDAILHPDSSAYKNYKNNEVVTFELE